MDQEYVIERQKIKLVQGYALYELDISSQKSGDFKQIIVFCHLSRYHLTT